MIFRGGGGGSGPPVPLWIRLCNDHFYLDWSKVFVCTLLCYAVYMCIYSFPGITYTADIYLVKSNGPWYSMMFKTFVSKLFFKNLRYHLQMENSIFPKSINERILSRDICWYMYLSVFTCEYFLLFFKVTISVFNAP